MKTFVWVALFEFMNAAAVDVCAVMFAFTAELFLSARLRCCQSVCRLV